MSDEKGIVERDEAYLARPDPERIFLAPRCEGLSLEGRTWSSDRHDCDEEGCGLKAVEYVRADALTRLQSREAALVAVLEEVREALELRGLDKASDWPHNPELIATIDTALSAGAGAGTSSSS